MVPDYYAMLGLDSRADRQAIESALARQQPIWSSGTRNPKNKHTYQSYLDQIPTIRLTLLGDPTTRAAYDAELAESRRAERDARLERLKTLVRLRAAKGGLTVTDRSLLRDRARALGLDDEDLGRLIETIPPRPDAPKDDDKPDPPVDAIDPSTRRQIRVALEHLNRRDLYDALGVARDAPAREIADRTSSERQRWMHKAQVTAEKTAWLEIIAYAQSHLTGSAERARYDRTLRLEAEETLSEAIAFAIEGIDRLDPGTKSALLDEGTARGLEPDRVERLLHRVCKQKGVAREAVAPVSPGAPPPRLLICRSCGGVSDFGQLSRGGKPQSSCRHCGAELRWACPVCQRSRWVDEKRCNCGFPIEHREPLIRHFAAAQVAFKACDHARALVHLERILDFAPQHAGARKAIEKVRGRLAEIQRIRAAWDTARSTRRLAGTSELLAEWERLVGRDDPSLQSAQAETSRSLLNARASAARARLLEASNPQAARNLYRQALELVADLPEARQGLLRCPPDPPSQLVVRLHQGLVRLDWTPPEVDDLGALAYRIVRKLDGVPNGTGDGERLGETESTTFEDHGLEAGRSVGYAVFSVRGPICSPIAASAGPIFVAGDVADLKLESRSGEVHLRWLPPSRAHHIRVVRKLGGPPTGPGDGSRVESQRDSAWDRELADDQVYHYGVFVEYRLSDGSSKFSKGVFASAVPHAPIAGLDAPALSRLPDGRLRLDWTPPAQGWVRILRTSRPMPLAFGATVSAAQIDAVEGIRIEPVEDGRAIDPSPPDAGHGYYTPLVGWAGSWTVGRPAVYSCLPDPTDLRVVRAGGSGRLHLRWRWSPRGSHSMVLYRVNAPPTGPDDPEAHSIVVSEGDYSRQGYLALTLPPGERGTWHLAVLAMATIEGQSLISPGLDPAARTIVPGPNPEVVVHYQVRRSGFVGRGWSLSFQTEPPGSPIPPTVLVVHPRTVPLSVDDGEVIGRFPAAQDGVSFPVRSAADLGRSPYRIFTDPQADPDGLPPIRLRHPEVGKVRA